MLPITNPPILIDPVNFSRPSFIENPPYEFQVGSNLYLVLSDSQTGNNRIAVFLSTDSGDTWAVQDQANAPVGSGRNFECFFESDTGMIAVCDQPGGAYRITLFNTGSISGTPGWGTSTATASFGSPSLFFFRQSGGTYVTIDIQSGHIRLGTNTGGVWSGPTTLASSAGFVQGGISDASDNAYIFQSTSSGSAVNIWTIDAAFSITGPVTLTNTWDGNSRPTLKIFGTSLAVAFIPGDGTESVVVEIGTPLSALVFTRYGVFTKPDVNEMESYATLIISDFDAKLNLLWVRLNLTTDPLIDELDRSVFDGVSTWSANTLFYDEIANPPSDSVPDQLDQFIHVPEGIQLADGTWRVIAAMETLDAGQPHCTGFFLSDPNTPPTLACPINNTVTNGVPFSAFLIASGGTPPYTFSIISGALPTGLNLNTSTGEISGTTTATGSYSYTAQVTDAHDLTATTEAPCPLTVGPPTPPPPGPGSGESNPVGCWELLRVDVTLMPARHLPTRGSVR